MKRNHLLPMLLLATACGNPHLDKLDGLRPQILPVIADAIELEKGPGLLAKEGMNVKTTEVRITAPIKVQNLDGEGEWKVEYRLEKGENFKIVSGSCKEEIKAAEDCQVEVEFSASTPDIYLDNLIITYYRADSPNEKKELKVPLRGERVTGKAPVPGSIQIKSSSQKDELDFGKTLVTEKPSGKTVIKNSGEADVKLSLSIEKGEHFSILSHNCSEVLKPQEECTVDISFNAEEEGIYQDKLVATFSSEGGEEEVTKFPLMGEKYSESKLETRGPLIASELLSKDIDFGIVTVGSSAKKQVEIQNMGSLSYNLKDLELTSGSFTYSGGKYPGLAGTCGDIILPGSCIIELVYSPSVPGKDAGTFTLTTKEGDQVALNLIGQGDEVKKCESTNEYLVVPEKSYPASQVIFPYLKSHSSTTAKLVTLYGTEVNGYIRALDSYVVKDGMVYVTFKLPRLEGEITNVDFAVNLRKIIQDNFKDTESLCLSSQSVRKCSGQEFSLASWQALKNSKFWDLNDRPVNARYEEQFVSSEKRCGAYDCMNFKTSYELSDLFELSKEELEQIKKDGTITLIFSDDTRLINMPRLSLKTKVVTDCGH